MADNFGLSTSFSVIIVALNRGVVPGGAGPQILADQLTLSQPEGADYAHQIILAHPDFQTFLLESVQDFLIKLGIKPLMHLLEISTFSLNNVMVRLTKIMNKVDKNWAHF